MEISEYFYEVRKAFDTELRHLPQHKDSICPDWTHLDLEQVKYKVIFEISKKISQDYPENTEIWNIAEKVFYNSIYLW